MDYDSLFRVLPKEPKKWSTDDVTHWLSFIGLQNLEHTFCSNSIDGSCLELLEESDLAEELGIHNKIVRKKLMHWLKIGLTEFGQHVKSTMQCEDIKQQEMEVEQILEQTDQQQVGYGEDNINVHDLMTNYIKNDLQSQQFQQPIMEEKQKVDVPQYCADLDRFTGRVSNELIIQPTEGPQTNFYCIKESGGKIGRHSSNQILILEESISRFHAEIVFNKDEFFLKDIGSTTGTFIKIENNILLSVGMVIELGSNQFEVKALVTNNGAEIQLEIIEGPNAPDKHHISLSAQKPVTTVGRKQTAELTFLDDHHLSNIHAKICLIDGRVYLEDMGSTNGSWLRLSREGQQSQLYPLTNGTIFKIGTTSTYTCRKTSQVINEKTHDSSCIICCDNDRDALYMPCKHNTACLRCSKNLKDCPICRTKILDIVRIYKN